jgi:hypothetical protein
VSAVTDVAVVEQAIGLLGALQIEQALELCTDDFVLELPFRADGGPRTMAGDDAKRFMRVLPKLLARLTLTDVVVHGALADGQIVAEYRSDGTTHAGQPYCNSYVGFFELREGRIARWREYFDPNIIARAFPGA